MRRFFRGYFKGLMTFFKELNDELEAFGNMVGVLTPIVIVVVLVIIGIVSLGR